MIAGATYLIISLNISSQLAGVSTSKKPQQMKMIPASFMSLKSTLLNMMSYAAKDISDILISLSLL